ncbi:MAG: hypothetical protein JWM75_1895 [Sphingomonas bacterium]|nr:hypothetical protein [Sphingomonas bacterium]
MTDRQAAGVQPMAKRTLVLATLGAILLAALIVLGAILPVEFNRDPLGIGKATGLARLWSPGELELSQAESAVRRAVEYPRPARSDVIEIPLGMVGGGVGPYSLEYKVRMKKDAVLIYEWEAIGLADPSQLAFDFHGHTIPKSDAEQMVVASHRKASAGSGRGSLVAPFDGIQGWYFDNSSSGPIVVRVKLTGFYDLVPSGQPGNESGITANLPVDEVRAKMILPKRGDTRFN